jgi:hypothetical protein
METSQNSSSDEKQEGEEKKQKTIQLFYVGMDMCNKC